MSNVIIEVLQGAAYVRSCPDDIQVTIIDYDNLEETGVGGVC